MAVSAQEFAIFAAYNPVLLTDFLSRGGKKGEKSAKRGLF